MSETMPKLRWWCPVRSGRRIQAWRACQPISDWQRRDDAAIEQLTEAHERSEMPCDMCEIGEPHACEREWWRQQVAHRAHRTCSDAECVCHVAAEMEREARELWPAISPAVSS